MRIMLVGHLEPTANEISSYLVDNRHEFGSGKLDINIRQFRIVTSFRLGTPDIIVTPRNIKSLAKTFMLCNAWLKGVKVIQSNGNSRKVCASIFNWKKLNSG